MLKGPFKPRLGPGNMQEPEGYRKEIENRQTDKQGTVTRSLTDFPFWELAHRISRNLSWCTEEGCPPLCPFLSISAAHYGQGESWTWLTTQDLRLKVDQERDLKNWCRFGDIKEQVLLHWWLEYLLYSHNIESMLLKSLLQGTYVALSRSTGTRFAGFLVNILP